MSGSGSIASAIDKYFIDRSVTCRAFYKLLKIICENAIIAHDKMKHNCILIPVLIVLLFIEYVLYEDWYWKYFARHYVLNDKVS